MDRTTQITLIRKSYTQDEIGQYIATESQITVYADVKSVSQTEYYAGGKDGMKPEYVFLINVFDYQNEDVISYNGKRYAVYRTYLGRNDTIELYVTLEGGA